MKRRPSRKPYKSGVYRCVYMHPKLWVTSYGWRQCVI